MAGYAAAKLGAWLDRSEWGESKDAADLALVAYWYAESEHVHNRLYETSEGNRILSVEEFDVPRAAAHLLGVDVVATIGRERADELLERWPGDVDFLVRAFVLRVGVNWPGDTNRRRALVDALTRGSTVRP